MPLPVSGAISFNNINVELGVAGTTQASLGQASYRTLAGVPSGAISMSNFYGKANQFTYTISSNTNNLNLRSGALAAGWNGTTKVVATINGGVVISSTSTGSYALTIDGSWPGGVELINNGVIVGRGGNGGNGAAQGNFPNLNLVAGSAGSSGGPALLVSSAVTLNNTNGRVGGGGGGGGGGKAYNSTPGKELLTYPGGGGGGGIASGSGGSGGSAGSGWSPPVGTSALPGSAGTLTSNGTGGYGTGGTGGNGGSYGSAGATGGSTGTGGRGNLGPYSGGAAGAAIVGNSNISYAGTGIINGSVS